MNCSPNSQLSLLPPGQVRGRCLALVPFGFNLVLPSHPLTPTSPCMEATFQDIPWEIRVFGCEVVNDPCGSEHFRVLYNSEWSSVRKKKKEDKLFTNNWCITHDSWLNNYWKSEQDWKSSSNALGHCGKGVGGHWNMLLLINEPSDLWNYIVWALRNIDLLAYVYFYPTWFEETVS